MLIDGQYQAGANPGNPRRLVVIFSVDDLEASLAKMIFERVRHVASLSFHSQKLVKTSSLASLVAWLADLFDAAFPAYRESW